MTDENPFRKNKYEIFYNLINSGLAGLLVLFGAFTAGHIDKEVVIFAGLASAIVFITKFKEYWDGERNQFSTQMFNFVKV